MLNPVVTVTKRAVWYCKNVVSLPDLLRKNPHFLDKPLRQQFSEEMDKGLTIRPEPTTFRITGRLNNREGSQL